MLKHVESFKATSKGAYQGIVTKESTSKQRMYKNAGHRKRLRERFLQSGLDGFLDYEIVELLLTLGTPRKDCKQIAKEAIKKFKGLRGVLDASLAELQTINGVGPNNAFGVKLFQAVSETCSKEKILGKISISSPKEVVDYLQKRLGREKREVFVALFLNANSHLIKISDVSVGIADASLAHPREAYKDALQVGAISVIFAHNHPSGNTRPSKGDEEITKQLISAGRTLGINMLDHIIISSTDYYSFISDRPNLFGFAYGQ